MLPKFIVIQLAPKERAEAGRAKTCMQTAQCTNMQLIQIIHIRRGGDPTAVA